MCRIAHPTFNYYECNEALSLEPRDRKPTAVLPPALGYGFFPSRYFSVSAIIGCQDGSTPLAESCLKRST
jgi:hypothetical protein